MNKQREQSRAIASLIGEVYANARRLSEDGELENAGGLTWNRAIVAQINRIRMMAGFELIPWWDDDYNHIFEVATS